MRDAVSQAHQGFNPLHCGAVVASERCSHIREPPRGCFNPLHCGAVVASGLESVRTYQFTLSFNPLHCGAVVASDGRIRAFERRSRTFQSPSLRGSGRFGADCRPWRRRRTVSIPFIAGQWSLPTAAALSVLAAWRAFQSPSLRGSGRFSRSRRPSTRRHSCFNPLHCGAVVASSELDATADEAARFQSPSLRGSGRFIEPPGGVLGLLLSFQSPSLRGSGRFKNQGGSK